MRSVHRTSMGLKTVCVKCEHSFACLRGMGSAFLNLQWVASEKKTRNFKTCYSTRKTNSRKCTARLFYTILSLRVVQLPTHWQVFRNLFHRRCDLNRRQRTKCKL